MTDNNVIRPGEQQTETQTREDSPAERIKSWLKDRLDRDIQIAGDDHPLVITAGTADSLQSNTPVEVQKILSDDLYQDPDVFFREWKQNHIAAVVREAKRRIKNAYGEDALYYELEHDHESFDAPRTIQLPKSNHELIEQARELGYNPSIAFKVLTDERKLITRDNGIGMTTAEAIDVWNEPAVSGSGTDLSSAGNKGIGSLTWPSIAGKEGAIKVVTRTLRETHGGEDVPARDRHGFAFYTYFGGLLPLPDPVPDGFHGIKFEMPIMPDVNPDDFYESLCGYCEVLPVQIAFEEVTGGVKDEEEISATTFKGRYDEEPSIFIDRPGEFAVALDTPDIVPKNYDTNTTFLLDNPIDRNQAHAQSIDTLWNEHIQIRNEQGLIVAGPNRGLLQSEVDELAGEREDIYDDDKPMPDVPLPTPVASRDNLTRDEASRRFFDYVDYISQQKEIAVVAEYINDILACDSKQAALDYIRNADTEWELFSKLVKQHGSYNTLDKFRKFCRFLDRRDQFDFTDDEAEVVAPGDDDSRGVTNHGQSDKKDWHAHPKSEIIELIVKLNQGVDAATKQTSGDPNLKDNRRNDVKLATLIATEQRWPIYVGSKINEDRCKVLWHDDNEPKAAVLKETPYSKWTDSVFDAGLIKNVPFTHDENEDCDKDWHVPDEIDADHGANSSITNNNSSNSLDLSDPDNFQERYVDVRCEENSSIDFTATIGDIMEALDDQDGGPISVEDARGFSQSFNARHIIVFPSNGANVSDHYDLIGDAALIKCNVKESEALLNYDTVYTIDQFEQACGDVRNSVYDPFNEHGYTISLRSLNATLDQHMLVYPDENNDTLADDVIYGNDLGDIISQDHEHYDRSRKAGWTQLINRSHLDSDLPTPVGDDDAWDDDNRPRVAFIEYEDYFEAEKVHAFFAHFADRDKWMYSGGGIGNVSAAKVLADGNPSGGNKVEHLNSKRASYRLAQHVTRAKYPQWDNDSEAWSYKNKSNSGRYNSAPKWTQELLLFCRDQGIDPTTENHDLRTALNQLADRCPNDQ